MLYVVFLLLVLDVVGVSLYILRKIKRPLDTIIAGMKRVEQGEEQVVIPPQKEKEFTEIGNAFNNMTKQLAAQRAENEKMAQSRQKMLLELSHDIKTPVATIKVIFMHFRNRWFQMWTFQNIMKRLREKQTASIHCRRICLCC